MLSSLVSMIPCSIILRADVGEGEEETALIDIDQRAVAAGRNANFHGVMQLFGNLCVYLFYQKILLKYHIITTTFANYIYK